MALDDARMAELELAGTKHVQDLLQQLEVQFQAEIPRLQVLVQNKGVPDIPIPQELEERIATEADEAASNAAIAALTEALEAGAITLPEFVQKIREFGSQHFERYIWPRLR
jgi:hypothetical protein